MSDRDEKTGVEEAVEELFTDPDAPDKGNDTRPPQTIDAEPSRPEKDAR